MFRNIGKKIVSFMQSVKYKFNRGAQTESIYAQVEKDVKDNKNNFIKYIYRGRPDYVKISNSKKKNPKLRKFISHTRILDDTETLESFLGHNELWDMLIDWKSLLGENIYLQRHRNKNG